MYIHIEFGYMKYFETIYHENLWHNKESISGDGATLKCSEPYLLFLTEFVKEHNIKKIMDIGCGDFNLMKNFDLSGISYLGIDIIKDLIDRNGARYTKDNIKFKHLAIHECSFKEEFDLILCKDLLQHWSNESTNKFFNIIKNYKYCLLTNDFMNNDYFNKNYNVNILDSEYTIVDLSRDPYNIPGKYVFEWEACNVVKKSFLIT